MMFPHLSQRELAILRAYANKGQSNFPRAAVYFNLATVPLSKALSITGKDAEP